MGVFELADSDSTDGQGVVTEVRFFLYARRYWLIFGFCLPKRRCFHFQIPSVLSIF